MLEIISSNTLLWLKSGQDLYIFSKADSTTSQGDLFQCLIALMVMIFFSYIQMESTPEKIFFLAPCPVTAHLLK